VPVPSPDHFPTTAAAGTAAPRLRPYPAPLHVPRVPPAGGTRAAQPRWGRSRRRRPPSAKRSCAKATGTARTWSRAPAPR